MSVTFHAIGPATPAVVAQAASTSVSAIAPNARRTAALGDRLYRRPMGWYVRAILEREASMDVLELGLAGKVAIVTGGSEGLGRACVERFAKSGAKVAA